jgi:hypothetical protein
VVPLLPHAARVSAASETAAAAAMPAGYAERSRRNIRPSADDTGKPGDHH